MTTMSIAPAGTGDSADNSWEAGYTDGELAAITGLPSRRAHARASMADQYDPDYAQGYIDGYLHATAVNAARTGGTA
ncbi:hypothetical protein [Streptomyces sp. NPDC095613]|uniref:hypothetical protein n=1 Tax=Streptomyces sp. NPDC095613 TaxID=3155540 RepID=UPI00331789A6